MTRIDELYNGLSSEDQIKLVYHLNKRMPTYIVCGDEFIGVHLEDRPNLNVVNRIHGWCHGFINKTQEVKNG